MEARTEQSIAPVAEGRASGVRVILEVPEIRTRPVQSCVMIGIASGDVLLECERWVEPSTTVILTFDRIKLSGRVRYCNRKVNGYRISVAVGPESPQERAAPRFPMDEPGRLIVLADGGSVSVPCRLTDFSRAGLGLKSTAAVAADSMICVETSSVMVAGNIRRCVPNSMGSFDVGIAVTDILSDRIIESGSSLRSGSGIRLWLAELILGRPIEPADKNISFFRSRR